MGNKYENSLKDLGKFNGVMWGVLEGFFNLVFYMICLVGSVSATLLLALSYPTVYIPINNIISAIYPAFKTAFLIILTLLGLGLYLYFLVWLGLLGKELKEKRKKRRLEYINDMAREMYNQQKVHEFFNLPKKKEKKNGRSR